jgi:hypothetical protein
MPRQEHRRLSVLRDAPLPAVFDEARWGSWEAAANLSSAPSAWFAPEPGRDAYERSQIALRRPEVLGNLVAILTLVVADDCRIARGRRSRRRVANDLGSGGPCQVPGWIFRAARAQRLLVGGRDRVIAARACRRPASRRARPVGLSRLSGGQCAVAPRLPSVEWFSCGAQLVGLAGAARGCELLKRDVEGVGDPPKHQYRRIALAAFGLSEIRDREMRCGSEVLQRHVGAGAPATDARTEISQPTALDGVKGLCHPGNLPAQPQQDQ